jgi:hypothetical protein
VPDLAGTVVAIIDSEEDGREAVAALSGDQFEAELLDGEQGRAYLAEDHEEGLSSVLKKLALAFGDEVRIVDRLDRALKEGRSVVIVDADEEEAAAVATILEDHGGHDMWRLGEWSFNRIGSEGSGEG